MNFLVIEAEGLPDIEGARRVLGLAQDLVPSAVARVLFHHHLDERGRAPFVDAHFRAVACMTLVRCRDEEISIETLSESDTSESRMLERLQDRLGSHDADVVVWNEGRSVASWLGLRALVQGVRFDGITSASLECRLGLAEVPSRRSQLVRRLGFDCLDVPSDEAAWKQATDQGFGPLTARCESNAIATAQLLLRHLLVSGGLTAEDHAAFADRLAALTSGRGAG